MGLYQHIQQSADVLAYGGGFWTFFNNLNGCAGNCQDNAVLYEGNRGLRVLGISTHLAKNMVLEGAGGGDLRSVAPQPDNYGGWTPNGGVIAAWLGQSG